MHQENEQLLSQIEALKVENQELRERLNNLSAQERTATPLPDLQAIRDRILKSLTQGKNKVATTSPQYKTATKVLDKFITELVATTGESTPLSTLPSAQASAEASTHSSAPDGTAAPLVDEAVRKQKEGNSQDEYYSNLKLLADRCGYRLSVTPLDTGRNVFHLHQKGSRSAEVSTQDINEVLAWLRRQDLLGE